MLFEGKNLTVSFVEAGIAELKFDAPGSVNKFDQATLSEFGAAVDAINQDPEVKGLIVTSGKSAFIVGADITEFLSAFDRPEDEIVTWVKQASDVFDKLEDVKVPSVAAISGFALGGGFEAALACDYRVGDSTARVGLPEVKLGLMPGFGATVRLPRLIGADNAMEWMSTGQDRKADKALKEGAIDAVVKPEKLIQAAIAMAKDAADNKLDWQARRNLKMQPLKLNKIEATMSFTMAKGMVAAKAGKHYPAPMLMVKTLEQAAGHGRAEAMLLENKGFATLAKTSAARAQIGIFLADQMVKSKAKRCAKGSQTDINKAAVLGAGIMGGGIAYQSASKGTPIVMKDINDTALNLGLSEASKLLNKQMSRGRVDGKKMATVLNNITPSLSYDSIKDVDIVVEAVVENPKVKAAVLKETQAKLGDNAIIASNTSTISIDLLAESLEKPENFCGMHFFNPVHRMPLVEVIRGKDTSDATVAAVVNYALKMGKSPIVVNDCPGFFVNRVLFPYFAGFSRLLIDGADFVAVDKVMEKVFGWPMGPAYLLDVVGMDTAYHCSDVMSNGFPERMQKLDNDPVATMFDNNRYGQKNGKGFYAYSVDRRGKPKKDVDEDTYTLLQGTTAERKEFSTDEIIARCMVPMINETIRCLEEGIVASPQEADMGLIYGIGFPPFRGGVFAYLEDMGLDKFVAMADSLAHLGEVYKVTDKTREMAANGQSFLKA